MPCFKLGLVLKFLCDGVAWQRFFSSCPLNIMEKKLLLAGNHNNNENIQKNNLNYDKGVALHVYHTLIKFAFISLTSIS